MIAFEVNDMTCGHCVGAITQALQAVDAQAQVQIDLGSRRVQVQAPTADADALAQAIREAGYHPVQADPAATAAACSASCGCGH